jgi:hypothetical protein
MARRIVLAHKPKPSLAFLFKRDEGQAAVLLKQADRAVHQVFLWIRWCSEIRRPELAVHASWEIAFKKDKTTL